MGRSAMPRVRTHTELIPCMTTFDAEMKLPMETIVQDIGSCDACFADLSQESSYLWFAIGCALALGKPLCLVSSKNVTKLRLRSSCLNRG